MTTTARAKGKVSPLFIALAAVTIALSSWGLFDLFTTYAEMPPELALLAVGGLDIVAVLCGKHALTVASDGDSSGPWNGLLLVFTALAAIAQYQHAALSGDPWIIGVTMAAFPIATVILFEGQLRRKARLEGRARGLVPPPRATVPLIVWLFFPKVAFRATRLATLDRGLTGDDAFLVAEAQTAEEVEQANAVTRRPQYRRLYPELEGRAAAYVEGGPALESRAAVVGDRGPERVVTPDTEELRDHAEHKPPVAPIVRAAVERVGADLDAVLAEVKVIRPDVERETVRRTLARIPTNGASHA
jgi:hypothetical protein